MYKKLYTTLLITLAYVISIPIYASDNADNFTVTVKNFTDLSEKEFTVSKSQTLQMFKKAILQAWEVSSKNCTILFQGTFLEKNDLPLSKYGIQAKKTVYVLFHEEAGGKPTDDDKYNIIVKDINRSFEETFHVPKSQTIKDFKEEFKKWESTLNNKLKRNFGYWRLIFAGKILHDNKQFSTYFNTYTNQDEFTIHAVYTEKLIPNKDKKIDVFVVAKKPKEYFKKKGMQGNTTIKHIREELEKLGIKKSQQKLSYKHRDRESGEMLETLLVEAEYDEAKVGHLSDDRILTLFLESNHGDGCTVVVSNFEDDTKKAFHVGKDQTIGAFKEVLKEWKAETDNLKRKPKACKLSFKGEELANEEPFNTYDIQDQARLRAEFGKEFTSNNEAKKIDVSVITQHFKEEGMQSNTTIKHIREKLGIKKSQQKLTYKRKGKNVVLEDKNDKAEVANLSHDGSTLTLYLDYEPEKEPTHDDGALQQLKKELKNKKIEGIGIGAVLMGCSMTCLMLIRKIYTKREKRSKYPTHKNIVRKLPVKKHI